DEKVVAQVVVDLCKTEWLEHQKADDQRTVEHERDVRQDLGVQWQMESRGQRADKIVEEDRRKQHESGAEKAAQNATETANNDHRDNLDRHLQVKLLRSNGAIVGEG